MGIIDANDFDEEPWRYLYFLFDSRTDTEKYDKRAEPECRADC